MRKVLTVIIAVVLIFSMAAPAVAVDYIEAKRSDTTFTVNKARMPLRAYIIEGKQYINLFELAISLSGSQKQFALRWAEDNTVLHLISGIPHNAIGLDSTRTTANPKRATPVDVKILLDGEDVIIPAFNISGEVFFSFREIASMLDFCVVWRPLINMIDIDADLTYEDSYTARQIIDPLKPMIALTYDDGPGEHTLPILDVLEKNGAAATFFVVGSQIEGKNDIVLRAHSIGCEIANHSWSHRRLDRISEDRILEELLKTNDAIEAIIGAPPSCMRPPYGSFNARVISVTGELGLPIIYWSLDPSDWRTRNVDKTYDRIMENVKDRDIILLHDLHEATAEASKRIIPALINRGFQLVTISELFYYSGIAPEPGAVYFSARGTGKNQFE